jgi:ABC-type sugar transport system ATPase subunit
VIECLAGIRKQSEGSVHVDDRRLRPGDRVDAVAAGVAYISGDRSRSSFGNHTVGANITMATLREVSTIFVPSRKEERERSNDLRTRVRLTAGLGRVMSSLSGGNQQKAVFARWLASDARVLLLHDPTAGVDVHARSDIHDQVRDLSAAGVAVVIVTTDMAELVELAQRLVVIDHGEVLETLTGDAISERNVTAAMIRARVPEVV